MVYSIKALSNKKMVQTQISPVVPPVEVWSAHFNRYESQMKNLFALSLCLLSLQFPCQAHEVKIHTVKHGDSLYSICIKHFKKFSKANMEILYSANPEIDRSDNLIKVGQKITLLPHIYKKVPIKQNPLPSEALSKSPVKELSVPKGAMKRRFNGITYYLVPINQ